MSLTKELAFGLIGAFFGVGVLAYLGNQNEFGWYAGLGGVLAAGAGFFIASLAIIKLVKKAINS